MENKSKHVAIEGIEVSLSDWWRQIVRRRILVLTIPVVFGVAASATTVLMPPIYKASTSILLRQPTQANAAAMLTQLGELSGSASGALSIQVPIDPNLKIPLELHVSLLKSRSVAENIVRRFKLQSVYGTPSFESARDMLIRNTSIQLGRDGLIRIEVEDADPSISAEIANSYVDEHRAIIRTLALSETSQRRLFIERKLQTVRQKMSKASITAREAQIRSSEADAKTSMSSKTGEIIARLRAEIAAKEVELGAFRAFSSAGNSEYENLQKKLWLLRGELAQYEGAKIDKGGESPATLEITNAEPFAQSRYYQTLLHLLEIQYQAAKDDELSDGSLIQILDKAVPPGSHFGPKKGLIIISAIIAGLFLGIFWVLIYDVLKVGRKRSSPTL